MARPPKLMLVVVDGLKPSALERAVSTGRAPTLGLLMDRGTYADDCCAAFPSVTPTCAATIATGVLQDRHHIPAMNWYSRAERRYVEYGSSFSASRRFGINRQLLDTVYNMNGEHLSEDVETVFETLDDADVRTAGTTYLMYRGRHEHEVSRDSALTRVLSASLFRRSVLGPRELFYADIFASRSTGCRGQLGLPGVRDQHTGCVGAYLVEHDLFDFLLLSLPDNDTHSHRFGPHAQVASIAAADRQIERVMHAGGGPEAFLAEHAVIVVADHSHAPVEERLDVLELFGDFDVLQPAGRPEEAEIAVCPSQRAGMVYALARQGRDELVPRIVEAALAHDGVDLAAYRDGDDAVAASARGELRFAPGDDVADVRGGRWRLSGDPAALDAEVAGGELRSHDYPDALARLWAATGCPTSGDVVLSAAPGWEFIDWGGVDHVGGGSHGALHRADSLGALVACGVEVPAERAGGDWSIRDVAGLVRGHFGLR